MTYEQFQGLSEHGRRIARAHVIDSTEELDLGTHLNTTPERMRTAR